MKKYLLILKAYFKGSLMNLMEYKFNFISGGTFELVWLFMYLIFIDTIFIHTETVNGWDKYRMLMLTFQGGLMDSVFTFLRRKFFDNGVGKILFDERNFFFGKNN